MTTNADLPKSININADGMINLLYHSKRNKHICLPPALVTLLKSDEDFGYDESLMHLLDSMLPGSRAAMLRQYILAAEPPYIPADFGPLWKRCEASGCTEIEYPGRKMKACAGCKRIYYCGAACQRAHWKEHKSVCKTREHPLQQLRSQEIYASVLQTVRAAYSAIRSGGRLDTFATFLQGVMDGTTVLPSSA